MGIQGLLELLILIALLILIFSFRFIL